MTVEHTQFALCHFTNADLSCFYLYAVYPLQKQTFKLKSF